MKLRFGLLLMTIIAIAGVFGIMRGLRNDSSTASPSQRAATASQLQLLEQAVRDRPGDVRSLTQLASAYVQRARETGDPAYYGLADTAIGRALAREPDNVDALIVSGTLALARHQFEVALMLGERAHLLDPDAVAAYGVIVDGLVELGRYDEALAAAQEMVDRRPDFASLTRASYLRELHGDIDGAIALMQDAADGAGVPFDQAWALVIVGNLHLQQNDVTAAAQAYHRAESVLPGDPMVNAALGRLAIQQGDAISAETLLRSAVEARPLPEYAIALGDLLTSQHREAEAADQYALVRATQQLFAANGVDTDLELALFDADHGNEPVATFSRALAAYARRPSVYAADTVAWAAYKAGRLDDARRYIEEAQRLGTRDARLAYHAGVIAQAVGDHAGAEAHLRDALSMEHALSLPYAADVRRLFETAVR